MSARHLWMLAAVIPVTSYAQSNQHAPPRPVSAEFLVRRAEHLKPGRQFTVDDLLANRQVVNAVIAPDGERAAVVITRPRRPGDRFAWDSPLIGQRADIWLVERRRGVPQRLTDGYSRRAGYWSPVWSPDSRRLAFLSNDGGDDIRLWTWDIGSRVVRPLGQRGISTQARVAGPASSLSWLDAKHILCVLNAPGVVDPWVLRGQAVRRIIDSLWRRTETGKTPSLSILEAGVSVPAGASPRADLVEVDVTTGRPRILLTADVRTVAVAPNRQWALVIVDDGNRVLSANQPFNLDPDTSVTAVWRKPMYRRLVVVPLRGSGRPERLSLRDPLLPSFDIWSSNGRGATVLVPRSQGDHATTAAFDTVSVTEAGTVLSTGTSSSVFVQSTASGSPFTQHEIALDSSARTGFALYLREDTDGVRLLAAPFAGARAATRMLLNQHVADVKEPRQFWLTYRGRDSTIRQAKVVLPDVQRPPAGYPLVTLVYPIPLLPDTLHPSWRMSKYTTYFLSPRLLIDHGFAVLLDPPVGDMHSNLRVEFASAVLPAIDSLVARHIADPHRLGLIGHSHGALETYALLTITDRFRAAVAINGPSDILHEYADFGNGIRYAQRPQELAGVAAWEYEVGNLPIRLGGTPWTNKEGFAQSNPINFLDRVVTPLMLVQSDGDVYMSTHADAWFFGLYRLGRRARYVRYWGEPHDLDSPANIRSFWRQTLAWFDQYLGN